MDERRHAAGLDEHHRFHDLRHTFGTAMAAAGVPMRTLQEWMGHRDIQTTQRYATTRRARAMPSWWPQRSSAHPTASPVV
jgi:site-specific recombinase XerD